MDGETRQAVKTPQGPVQGRTRAVVAADLKPAMWLLDEDRSDWLEVTAVKRRFGLMLVTVEDSSGNTSTWPLLVERKVTVEAVKETQR